MCENHCPRVSRASRKASSDLQPLYLSIQGRESGIGWSCPRRDMQMMQILILILIFLQCCMQLPGFAPTISLAQIWKAPLVRLGLYPDKCVLSQLDLQLNLHWLSHRSCSPKMGLSMLEMCCKGSGRNLIVITKPHHICIISLQIWGMSQKDSSVVSLYRCVKGTISNWWSIVFKGTYGNMVNGYKKKALHVSD